MPEEQFIQKVLVVVDESAEGEKAFCYARDFCRATGAALSLAYVVDSASMDLLGKLHILITEEQELFLSEMEMRGKRLLQQLRAEGGIPMDTYLLRGRVHQAVLRAARELAIDTIVLAGWQNIYTRKDTTSMERHLILDQADCPVIIVK